MQIGLQWSGFLEVPQSTQEIQVEVDADGVCLPGALTIPSGAIGAVIFAHGSGSSRLSPRNVMVAHALVERGCATLLFDLLTPAEVADRRQVFNIPLLARRMLSATGFIQQRSECRGLSVGYFGASTGAAAALVATAELGSEVTAVVSRGGRPDLAGDSLPLVQTPTLLIVGSLDAQVLELNRQAQARMRCETRLQIIEGATHLFEEPGTPDEAARAAADWFVTKFVSAARAD